MVRCRRCLSGSRGLSNSTSAPFKKMIRAPDGTEEASHRMFSSNCSTVIPPANSNSSANQSKNDSSIPSRANRAASTGRKAGSVTSTVNWCHGTTRPNRRCR